MKSIHLLCLLLFVTLPFPGVGQSGSLDLTFDPGISTNGESMIFAVAEMNDGRIVAGGNFSSYQEVPRNGLVALQPDGSIDPSFADVMPAGTTVYDIAVDAQGRLLVAGYFFAAGSTPMNGITRLLPNGELDPTFDPGGGTNYSVHKVLPQDDGKIVIGGQFVSVNGLPFHGVARLLPDGAVDMSFEIGAGFLVSNDPGYPYVRTIALDNEENILVGGDFDHFNNTPVGQLVRLTPSGSLDASFQSTVSANSVIAIAVLSDGRIRAGGQAISVAGGPEYMMVGLLPDGDPDPQFVAPVIAGDYINAITPTALEDELWVGGRFTQVNDLYGHNLARLSTSGALLQVFDVDHPQPGHSVEDIHLYSGDRIIVGGQFQHFNQFVRRDIFLYDLQMDCSDALVHAGGLTASMAQVCLLPGGAMVGATAAGGMMVPDGYITSYLLTSGGVIQQMGTSASFTVTGSGSYTIHTLVHPATLDLAIVTTGVTTAANVHAMLVQGGGDICASLDLTGATVDVIECGSEDCAAWHGSLVSLKNVFCYSSTGSVIGAMVVGDAVVPPGYVASWLVSSGEDLIIEQVGDMAWFVVDGMGLYTIHTLVYDPGAFDLSNIQPGVTTAYDIHAMFIAGGGGICASLDMDGVTVIVDDPEPPTLTAHMEEVCMEGGMATVSATVGGDMHLPIGYGSIHILTMGEDKVVKQTSSTASFQVMDPGHYTIHTFVYDPQSFPWVMIETDVSTAYDLHAMLVEGGGIYCAALDLLGAGTEVIVCEPSDCLADAGVLTSDSTQVCLTGQNVTLTATSTGSYIPEGYAIGYVWSIAPAGAIISFTAEPQRVVSSPGHYFVNAMVYDPVTFDPTTAIDPGMTSSALSFMVSSSGICASLGAVVWFHVMDCTVDCTASAGTIEPSTGSDCIDGLATLVAIPAGNAVVPDGYTTTYLLTKNGPVLTIQGINTVPSFDVGEQGYYNIHTLVHDPATINPESFVGTTTINEVNALLLGGGGMICGSLNQFGAFFTVGYCECVADAGQLVAVTDPVCHGETFVASSVGAVVPDGFEMAFLRIYVSTPGQSFITHVYSTPEIPHVGYMVSNVLIPIVYDPNILDVSTLVGFYYPSALEYMVMPPGMCGSIGAGILAVGIDCTECDASTGELTVSNDEICLNEGGAHVSVMAADAVIPDGYSSLYLITQGSPLVVAGMSNEPDLTINSTGTYAVVLLVYDSTTFSTSSISLGSELFHIVEMVTGSPGSCAAITHSGVSFEVVDCTTEGLQITNAWPVPTTDRITVTFELSMAENAQLAIFNTLGAQVGPSLAVGAGSEQVMLDVAGLESGLYTIRLQGNGGVSTYNFTKEN